MYFMQNSKSNLPEAVKKELLKLPTHQDWVIPNIHIVQHRVHWMARVWRKFWYLIDCILIKRLH